MCTATSISAFVESVEIPLKRIDPLSYKDITAIVEKSECTNANLFSTLLNKLGGKNLDNITAFKHWHYILEHKQKIEKCLARYVHIQIAILDYYGCRRYEEAGYKPLPAPATIHVESTDKETSKKQKSKDHLKNLKIELLRSERYKHTLSAILLDVDNFKAVNDCYSYEIGNSILKTIEKIITNLIRTVDIASRFDGDRFIITLPNTNKREAQDLAERIRIQINERTQQINPLSEGITATLAICQCGREESANEILNKLSNMVVKGKKEHINHVYSL